MRGQSFAFATAFINEFICIRRRRPTYLLAPIRCAGPVEHRPPHHRFRCLDSGNDTALSSFLELRVGSGGGLVPPLLRNGDLSLCGQRAAAMLRIRTNIATRRKPSLIGTKMTGEGWEMKRWTLDDIPWDRFDATKVVADIVPVIKTASLVEYNSGDYAAYLRIMSSLTIRPSKPPRTPGRRKSEQHGEALGRWAETADPGFDFEASFRRFVDGFSIPVSHRPSRCGDPGPAS